MSLTDDYLLFPGSATVGEVLQSYRGHDADYWWLLVVNNDGKYSVCSFGSLLPYLTGRTDHIVHRIGDCVICGSVDPLLWQDTASLVVEVMADESLCRRRLTDLPLADLSVVDADDPDQRGYWWLHRAALVMQGGEIAGMHIQQMRGGVDSVPSF